MPAGYVYIVHGVGTPYVTVGKTMDVPQRLHELSQEVPFPVRILSIELVHDMDAMELALKARYAAYRRRGDEWFAMPQAALAAWPVVQPEPKEQDVPLRLVREKPSLQAKIVQLFETHDVLTVRAIQRLRFASTASAIKHALRALADEGVLVTERSGRMLLYRRADVA